MPHLLPEWQNLAIYALAAALMIMLPQRIPYVGRIVRFAFSVGLLAFLIFVILQQPGLARLTDRLGIDRQTVSGKEVHVPMSPDGHFWVTASINGTKARMLIDSGATVTAVSPETARAAGLEARAGLFPVVLKTANGLAPAKTGSIRELHIGNIVARNLKVVSGPGLAGIDVLGMNFLSKLQSWRVENGMLILVPHHPQNVSESQPDVTRHRPRLGRVQRDNPREALRLYWSPGSAATLSLKARIA